MKTLLKLFTIAFVIGLSASFAKASTCEEKKDFMIKEITAAIATYPNSCKATLNIMTKAKCRLLFNGQLQKLIGVIEKDEFANLAKVNDFISGNRSMIMEAIADEFQKQTTSLLGDLNTYHRQCSK
jgi:hypothetical protein